MIYKLTLPKTQLVLHVFDVLIKIVPLKKYFYAYYFFILTRFVVTYGFQLSLRFFAFRENRLPFNVKVKDPHSEALGRIAFMREPKSSRQEVPQTPICNLNVALPDNITPEPAVPTEVDLEAIQNKYAFLREAGYGKIEDKAAAR